MKAVLVVAANGRVVGGAADDVDGNPSWWSIRTGGRRVQAATEAEAMAALEPLRIAEGAQFVGSPLTVGRAS